MRIIRLRGTPFERGLSQGAQCKREIRQMVRFMSFFAVRASMPDARRGKPRFRYILNTVAGFRQKKRNMLDTVRAYEAHLKPYWPDAVDEMNGIAKGAEVQYEDVLLINMLAEMVNGCSVWAACGSATKSGQPLLGMNSDEEKATSRFEIVKVIEPDQGYRVIANSMAGWVILGSGVNERGLAMAFPMLWLRRAELPRPQMPTLALYKAWYECATVDDALAVYQDLPVPAVPIAHYIADVQKVARIEWARVDRDVTVIDSGILSNTNRPESEKFKEYDATLEWDERLTFNAVSRQTRMRELLERSAGKIDKQAMMAIATDHGEGDTRGRSICQHSRSPLNVATVSSLIAKPSERKVWISGCTPCKTGFQAFSFQ